MQFSAVRQYLVVAPRAGPSYSVGVSGVLALRGNKWNPTHCLFSL